MSDVNFQAGGQDQDPGKQGGGNSGEADPVLEYGGRSFTKEDVLTKIQHADSHIETLTAEREADRKRIAELEVLAAKASKVDELIAQLGGKGGDQPAGDDHSQAAKPDANNGEPQLSVAEQLEALLEKRDAAKSSDKNWQEVTSKLTATFGEKTNSKVAEVAAENDMTLQEAEALARSKPKAFLRLFGSLSNGSSAPGATGGGRFAFSGSNNQGGKEPSGYADAKTTKDQVNILRAAYARHGLI